VLATAVVVGAAVAAPTMTGGTRASAAEGHTRAATEQVQNLAASQALRTGRPVTVGALTTPDSVTQALPDGLFRLTASSQPVRAWTRHGWQSLDADLRREADGTWSPALASSPVTVSGGGSGPLTVMSNMSRTLAIYWPWRLPKPTVSGATATYRSVLPGADLQVTVSDQGGLSDMLIMHNREAAASPRLRHLKLTLVSTGGLSMVPGHGGALQSAGGGSAPAFTSTPWLTWDSAAADRLSAVSHFPGVPVRSAITPPQVIAGTARQTLTVAATAPPSGGAVVYPLYASSGWLPSGGSKGWYASDPSTLPRDNWYDKTGDPSPQSYLQIGDGGQYNAHTFVEFDLHPSQLAGADIHSAVLGFKMEHSWSCTPTPAELWWAGTVPKVNGKRWVSWNHEPAWIKWRGRGSLSDGAITSVSAGNSKSCHSETADIGLTFNISNFMKFWGPRGPSSVAFGLRAATLNDEPEWKEFSNAGGAITMTTYYAHKPDVQASSYSSPGGDCQSVSPARTAVGDDDLTLNTTPYDRDPGSLRTRFTVLRYKAAKPLLNTTVASTSGVDFPLIISRNTLQSWGAGEYEWYTTTENQANLTNGGDKGIGSEAEPCYFTYDPSAPPTPGLKAPTPGPDGAIGDLGKTAQFIFGQCSEAVDSPSGSCPPHTTAPAEYVYQIDDGPPVTVPAKRGALTETITIPLTRYGENTISVVGVSAAGNPSGQALASFTVDPPPTPYGDGDYAGTGHPDLITVGDGTGSASEPGLWMAESDGSGRLGTPVDIGVQGTGTTTYETPGSWAGTQVLHGDFTGHHVQDIVAYDPADGSMHLIDGPGLAAELDPEYGNISSTITNPLGIAADDPGCTPTDVVAAGNATLKNTGLPDLAVILPYPTQTASSCTSGYELGLFYGVKGDTFADAYDHAAAAATTTQSPDGKPWGPDWTLEVAQPSSGPVLLALDTSNGQLWESANTRQSPSTLIGSPGTWTQVTGGPWTSGTKGPALVQADVNSAGHIELWTVSGAAATAWVVSPPAAGSADATLTTEAVGSRLNPQHAWPLTDGHPGVTSLVDTESTASYATPGSGVTYTNGASGTWGVDPKIGPVAIFDGSKQSFLTMPAGILQGTTPAHAALQSVTLTIRFRADPGSFGILAGTSTASPTGATMPNTSAPIFYIGTDGRLYAQFPSGHINRATGVIAPAITPLTSPGPVTDGQWHTVALVADGTSHDQVLYLDNDPPVHLPGNGATNPADPPVLINPGQTHTGQGYGADQVTIGGGIFSTAGWVNADRSGGNAGTTRASYFTPPASNSESGVAEISDIEIYPQALTQAQFPHNTPQSVTTALASSVHPGPCIDNKHSDITDGNPIDVYTCNGTSAQQWTIEPDGTIRIAASTSYCLDVIGSGTRNGTLLDLHTCTSGDTAQQWQLLSDGEILNTRSGKCINDPTGSVTNGTRLQLWNCDGTPASVWTSTARPPESPAAGTIVSVLSGLCAQDPGGSIKNFTPVQVGTCNGSAASQQWTFQSDGSIRINNKCLDNSSAHTGNGNPEDIYTCNGTGAQEWAHLDTGAFYNPPSGKCLDGRANKNGTQIAIWQCNYTADQTWIAPDTYNR
jgi:hypothetical protein